MLCYLANILVTKTEYLGGDVFYKLLTCLVTIVFCIYIYSSSTKTKHSYKYRISWRIENNLMVDSTNELCPEKLFLKIDAKVLYPEKLSNLLISKDAKVLYSSH